MKLTPLIVYDNRSELPLPFMFQKPEVPAGSKIPPTSTEKYTAIFSRSICQR